MNATFMFSVALSECSDTLVRVLAMKILQMRLSSGKVCLGGGGDEPICNFVQRCASQPVT